MNDEQDKELPLHAEAKARSAWRGGETILAKGGKQGGLPASEVDDAAAPDPGSGEAAGSVAPGTVPPPD